MLNRLRALWNRDDLSSADISEIVDELPHAATLPPDVEITDEVTVAAIGPSEGDADAGRATHAAHPELGRYEP